MNNGLKYDSNLSKGGGLLEEILVLLEAYEPGLSKEQFYEKVFQRDLLGKTTEARASDIIRRVFFKRYWSKESFDLPGVLQKLRHRHISFSVLRQILLIYTCRTNLILRDFLTEVYFDFVNKGYHVFRKEDFTNFILQGIKDGMIDPPWSASMIERMGRYINGALKDFGFLDDKKNVLSVQILETTANYLAHELHFRGHTDDQILHHPDWQLFDMHAPQAAELLQRISWQGHFIFQYSGELLKISWKYTDMESFIDGLTN